ncbi:MAG: hypothetical protein CME63_03325 [Halobacteriovoraceae bacterium]|nr:hypothetical protein [Halobacteriovoraceae bacterium]|tara:strand:+ start:43298 stop:44038 length:741 start_codon:yes stop_codon:yes gene_type:complete
MKRFNLKIFILLFLVGLVACGKETTTVNNNSSDSSSSGNGSGSGTGSGSSGSCPTGRTGNEAGVATDGQTINYYKIPFENVVMHGAPDGVIVFNSQYHLPANYQNLMKSDSRFNLRIIPKEISKGTIDSQGNECKKIGADWPFTILDLKVVVRSASGSAGDGQEYVFNNVPINCASEVAEFDASMIPTNDPLVIEIMNAKNDQDCLEDQAKGNGRTSYCPTHTIGSSECYGLEIQFSTDTTKDIPH